MAFQTEFEFTLPKGYVDPDGVLHKKGVMRLATAADEILPQKDPRVQANPAYLVIIVLARVIVRLGDVWNITTKTIEDLFSADLAYLQEFYNKVNETGKTPSSVDVTSENVVFAETVSMGEH
jgi:predicted nuclease of predicted toxin-antitoxin system